MTVNGEDGNDTFQVGQIVDDNPVELRRPLSGAVDSPTPRCGRLTNGVSFPATINGGRGDDRFNVFHNLAALHAQRRAGRRRLRRSAPSSRSTSRPPSTPARAATSSSTSSTRRSRSTAATASTASSLIGTEADDKFVITADGIYGGGRFITYVEVETVEVDGQAGDDRFFVLSTAPGVQTRIFGWLGCDTINVAGDAPAVEADDLLGHNGLIEHFVTSAEAFWTGIAVDGIAADIADDDEPAIVLTPIGRLDGGRTSAARRATRTRSS